MSDKSQCYPINFLSHFRRFIFNRIDFPLITSNGDLRQKHSKFGIIFSFLLALCTHIVIVYISISCKQNWNVLYFSLYIYSLHQLLKFTLNAHRHKCVTLEYIRGTRCYMYMLQNGKQKIILFIIGIKRKGGSLAPSFVCYIFF